MVIIFQQEFGQVPYLFSKGPDGISRNIQLRQHVGILPPQGRTAGGAIGHHRLDIRPVEQLYIGQYVLFRFFQIPVEKHGKAAADLALWNLHAISHPGEHLDCRMTDGLINVLSAADVLSHFTDDQNIE